MTTIKQISALFALFCLLIVTTACPKSEKDKGVAFARDLVGAMEAAAPIIAQKSAELAAKWTTATNSARQLINAIDASDSVTAAALVRDILPVFTEVVRQFSNDQNLLIALALGQIALNYFINHFTSKAVTALNDPVVTAYRSLPQFGCQLRPERCK